MSGEGPQRVTFRGKRWRLRWCKKGTLKNEDGEPLFGHTDAPNIPNKAIDIEQGQTERLELETLLHEGTHACLWDLDEEAVHETSRDLARFLWALGWRRTVSPGGRRPAG